MTGRPLTLAAIDLTSYFPDALILKDLSGVILQWNSGAERMFGYRPEEIIGRNIRDIVPSDRQAELATITDRLRSGDVFSEFQTERRTKDGTILSVALWIFPVRDALGEIVGAVKIARDMSRIKANEEKLQLRASEAEHRAKNILAAATATVRLSTAATVDELKSVIHGRLRAIADVTGFGGVGQPVPLDRIVANELLCAGSNRLQATWDGPTVLLDPDQAQSMALILHELTTNCLKYGALSQPEGRVRVEWASFWNRIDFHWTESGLSDVAPPTRSGFGSQLIRTVADRQLKGRPAFFWRSTGLSFRLSFDLKAISSEEEVRPFPACGAMSWPPLAPPPAPGSNTHF
ncbi:sensor histidine kinase [Bradyrhizobium oligotrophicum]|uniref:sensor histidine kinase n=1 Tax=Bradyrhizobium oligotrophicum TaxID=44255 RepID=UPI003EBDCC31